MNRQNVFDELLKAYFSDDGKLFNELNDKYHLGLTSLDQVELVEDRPTFDLSRYYEDWNGQYFKNYTTSRFIVNMEPLPKHILKKPEFNIVSYSYMIYHVLTALQENPDIDEVLNNVELQFPRDVAKDLLSSQGFVEIKSNGDADITSYGFLRLRGVNWVNYYDSYLDYFDFDDFERYMKENDTGSVFKNSLNYLDEHLKIAYGQKQFNRMHDVFSSKAMIYLHEEEFKNALIEELKIFILKINAIFLDKKDLESFYAIEYPNINNILELESLAEINNLKRALYRAWFDLELDDEMLLTKKEAFDYLKRACDGEVIDELAGEVADKYFK